MGGERPARAAVVRGEFKNGPVGARSVVHGGAAWRGAGERRTVIQFYGPRRGSMPSSKLGYKAMYPRL